MPAGRPSKYDPAYCQRIINHMAEGASVASFAAEIGVARDTISEWANRHPEFSAAVKIAKAKCGAWWETQGRNLAVNGGGSATLVIFGLKNMSPDDWREKQEIQHGGKVDVRHRCVILPEKRVAEISVRPIKPDGEGA